jgi:hypothetical protein
MIMRTTGAGYNQFMKIFTVINIILLALPIALILNARLVLSKSYYGKYSETFKNYLIRYIFLLCREIPNILTIIAFSSFVALITHSMWLYYLISWLLYIYLAVKTSDQMQEIKEMATDKNEKSAVQSYWLFFASITIIISNLLLSEVAHRLLTLKLL